VSQQKQINDVLAMDHVSEETMVIDTVKQRKHGYPRKNRYP
jgi:hypothetical protein